VIVACFPASSYGGGIYADRDVLELHVDNCTFSRSSVPFLVKSNMDDEGPRANDGGGGIHSEAPLTLITDSTFDGCRGEHHHCLHVSRPRHQLQRSSCYVALHRISQACIE
jgi:hypothetical protein